MGLLGSIVGAPAALARAIVGGGGGDAASARRDRADRGLVLDGGEGEFGADRPGDDSATPTFVCERVCTSKRLLRRMGGLAKDPTPNTCVTVCGAARADACSEACQRAVCANLHQVPAWNDACMRRCESECLKAVDGAR